MYYIRYVYIYIYVCPCPTSQTLFRMSMFKQALMANITHNYARSHSRVNSRHAHLRACTRAEAASFRFLSSSRFFRRTSTRA